MTAGSSTASPPTCWLSKATAISNGSKAIIRTTKPIRNAASAWKPTSRIASNTSVSRGRSFYLPQGRGESFHLRRNVFHMRRQRGDAVAVVGEVRGELFALVVGDPDALDAGVQNLKAVAGGDDAKIDLRRRGVDLSRSVS